MHCEATDYAISERNEPSNVGVLSCSPCFTVSTIVGFSSHYCMALALILDSRKQRQMPIVRKVMVTVTLRLAPAPASRGPDGKQSYRTGNACRSRRSYRVQFRSGGGEELRRTFCSGGGDSENHKSVSDMSRGVVSCHRTPSIQRPVDSHYSFY